MKDRSDPEGGIPGRVEQPTARQIIADGLPSWLGCYDQPPKRFPGASDLLASADEIIAALNKAGWIITRGP